MRPLVLNVALGAGCVLLLIVIYVFVVAPAARRAEDVAVQARIAAEEVRRLGPDLAGDRYRGELRALRGRAHATLEGLASDLAVQSLRLESWFPQLGITDSKALPAPDAFTSAYGFSQDRLKEEVQRQVREAAAIELRDVPLMSPVFQAQGRAPRKEELLPAQWAFNVERTLLLAAARFGAYPRRATAIDRAWRAERGADGFESTSARLALRMPADRLAACVRGLLELDGKGPIVRLIGLASRPMPEPDRLLPTDVITIDADVALEIATLPRQG